MLKTAKSRVLAVFVAVAVALCCLGGMAAMQVASPEKAYAATSVSKYNKQAKTAYAKYLKKSLEDGDEGGLYYKYADINGDKSWSAWRFIQETCTAVAESSHLTRARCARSEG